jgi:multiple sugar transport system substrate-binding protein
MIQAVWRRGAWLIGLAIGFGACGAAPPSLTISGSAVGSEASLLRAQLQRFETTHPGLRVQLRATPDAADERHQLYVQWLNARIGDPDVLQLDVIWTAEFAAAGWIRPLLLPADDFVPAALEASRWNGRLYALPWFVDVAMLYWRTDLMAEAPTDLDQLAAVARRAVADEQVRFGFVWQGARYEGLVTVFLETLSAFGGRILDAGGSVSVDSEAAVRALTFMRDAIHESSFVPAAVLAWREEPVRFAFQNGQAAFMRNWPYAEALADDPEQSRVAGRFAVAAMPGTSAGSSAAALGGSLLAVNAFSDDLDAAVALAAFLTEPDQMIERVRITGQLPARGSVYDAAIGDPQLQLRLQRARAIIARAVPRPVTPVYNELSEILQVHLHRALTRQDSPRAALTAAAQQMRRLLAETGLATVTP